MSAGLRVGIFYIDIQLIKRNYYAFLFEFVTYLFENIEFQRSEIILFGPYTIAY